MSNTFGKHIQVTLFGESHGPDIGCVIDGFPAGILLDMEQIKKEMARRAPSHHELGTPRKEMDSFTISSGVFNGYTCGTPLLMSIKNQDKDSSSYEKIKDVMRPGHADYSAWVKMKEFADYRGGGHFSGRLTAPLVFVGAICKQLLAQKQIIIASHIKQLSHICDDSFNPLGEKEEILHLLASQKLPVLTQKKAKSMEEEIKKARKNKDSVGGIVECMVQGFPAGCGAPFFDSIESVLSHALFSIPSVKGVEFGDGFAMASGYGSSMNDSLQFESEKVIGLSNHNGGILGGISNGLPLRCSVAIKPTPSIGKMQSTINVRIKENTTISIEGRHDSCIIPRVLPVIESVMAWVLADILCDEGLLMK